jgi:hypothetical protein
LGNRRIESNIAMKQPRITRLLPVLVALALLSCRKEEPVPVPSDTGNLGTVAFRVHLPVSRVIDYGTKASQTSYDNKTQVNFLFYHTDGTLDEVSSRYYAEPPPGGIYYLLPEEGMRYLYVVANVPYDMREAVPTITDLKNFSFQASPEGIPQNHMFGWLSPDEAGSENPVYIASDKQFDVYLKRLVAMVTIAFYRNDVVLPLDKNVTITPTRIALKNVPITMRLGDNKITEAGASIATGDLLEDPTGISLDLSSHTTSNPALFLYENRQPNGVFTSDQTMKIPVGHTAANLHTNYSCSYLEVTANYSDITSTDPKEGTITYRFFPGKERHR